MSNTTSTINTKYKTLSDLVQLFDSYSNALYGPELSEVRFGCDCGCGGDSYTSEEWDAEIEQNAKAIEDMKEFCKLIGVDYNGIYAGEDYP